MGRGRLSPEEVQLLKENPNVLEVFDNRIIYTNEFKVRFVQEYRSGKGPTQIFREAGFNVAVLGSKRIERAAANWKESYYANSLGLYEDRQFMNKKREKDKQIQIDELKDEVKRLNKKIQEICAVLGTE